MSPSGVEDFGACLRRLRQAACLTQEQLAQQAGISTNAVSQLERGLRRRPYPHTVQALADALELDGDLRSELVASAVERRPAQEPLGTAPSRGVLPVPPTQLIGREREAAALCSLLTGGAGTRMVTLTGTGGVGKTRLALTVAACLENAFADGVVFVGLAPLSDPDLVIPTIARAVGLREQADMPIDALLPRRLRSKELLLVLDNVEHLLEAAPRISELLRSCPALRVLATSRARLRISGEHEHSVEPLAVPEGSGDIGAEHAFHVPAVELFLARARDADPAFSLNPANAGDVTEICRRLGGLPLAVEVVAARVRLLAPGQLLARLHQVLRFAGARDLPDRQRTLRATLDWSHDLLSPAEQALFRRLSVLSGGFDLEAAEALGAGEGIETADVLGLLEGLWDQSLLQVAAGSDDAPLRYGWLEPVRQYAFDRLVDNREDFAVRNRHAALFLDLAERADSELEGPDQARWLAVLDRDHDNLRTALSWGERPDGDILSRLAVALRRFWLVRGHLEEGRRWLGAALRSCPSTEPTRRAKVLGGLGDLALKQGDLPSARDHFQDALAAGRWTEDAATIAAATRGLAEVALWKSAHEDAARLCRDSLARWREAGNARGLASALNIAGLVEIQRGRHREAAALLEKGLGVALETGDTWTIATLLDNLGWVDLYRHEHEQAAQHFRSALERYIGLDEKWLAADCLDGLARVALTDGDPPRAARLWGAAEGMCELIGATTAPLDPLAYQCQLSAARTQIGAEAFEQSWREGHSNGSTVAVAEARYMQSSPSVGSDTRSSSRPTSTCL